MFDRVNSAGKPITRAQVFHALFASDAAPGSPGSVREELRRVGFGSLDENRIVQSLLAIRGGDVQRDIHGEFGADEDPADWFDRTEQALVRVIGFLRSTGVPHVKLMPNTLPLPVLAAFFTLHPEPSPWNLRLLSRWLWRGWVHGFGGDAAGLRRAVNIVNPIKGSPDRAPTEYDAVRRLLDSVPDRKPPPIELTGFRTNKASSSLILLALASLRPQDADGKVIDLAERLETVGADAVTEFVPQLRSNAAARGFWPHGTFILYALKNADIKESHLVGADAADALEASNFDRFVQLRGESLQELVHLDADAYRRLSARRDKLAVLG